MFLNLAYIYVHTSFIAVMVFLQCRFCLCFVDPTVAVVGNYENIKLIQKVTCMHCGAAKGFLSWNSWWKFTFCFLQVLLSHMKYPVVPRRITISKRLAQCMHPALPSGVHLKALETYDIIFKCMGTNRLSQELFIYSAGNHSFFHNVLSISQFIWHSPAACRKKHLALSLTHGLPESYIHMCKKVHCYCQHCINSSKISKIALL